MILKGHFIYVMIKIHETVYVIYMLLVKYEVLQFNLHEFVPLL